MTNKHPWIGKTVGGCRLDHLIGKGGMGAVFRAHQFHLDRTVAIKIMSKDNACTPGSQTQVLRFRREARLAAQLQHPNAVQIYDVGEEDQLCYIIMQFVDGNDLHTILEKQGKFLFNEAAHVLQEVTKALIAAHARHIIHRDIKPANILKRKDGSIIVTDFGLARPLGANTDISTPGNIIGTMGYMSPEQAAGESHIDYRADIYALGATVYHLMAGEPPIQAKSLAQLIYKQINEEIPDLRSFCPGINDRFAELIHDMLQYEKEKRPGNTKKLLLAVEKAMPMADTRQRQAKTPRQITQLLSVSLLSGETQLATRVQKLLALDEDNPCPKEGCSQTWEIPHIMNMEAILYKKQIWCPPCLWEQFSYTLSDSRIGEMEKASFGIYWLAIKGLERYLPGILPQIFYCFPMKSSKKGWERMLQRIQRGYALTSQINSKNLMRTSQYLQIPEQEIAYVPMDYHPTVTLAFVLEEMKRQQKKLTLQESVNILRKLAQSLSVLHSKKIVHRNITPNSIYINLNGGISLGNFTMAKSYGAGPDAMVSQTFSLPEYWMDSHSQTLGSGDITTNLKSVVGTLSYMSPEQTMGSYGVNNKSDLWSWGIIAYELLEGMPPFYAKNPWELVTEIREDEIPPFRAAIPIPLQKAVMRALERDIKKRYQNAGEIKRTLDLIKLPGE